MAFENGAGKIPNWLSAVHLKKLLADTVPDYEKLIKFAVTPDDNILSHVLKLRAEVQLKDGTTKTLAYRLKSAAASETAFGQLDFRHTTPAVLDSTEAQLKQQFYEDIVLFVDQQAKGYKKVNPAEGLDMRHTQAALEQLAVFHASTAISAIGPQNGAWAIPTKTKLMQYQQRSVIANRKFHESLRSYNLRHFEDKIKTYQQYVLQKCIATEKLDPLDFNVALHGALSSHNVLFQYDAFGNIKDALFIDFQMGAYGSPVKDLIYLLLSSTRCDEKLKNFDFYLKYYHDYLISNLKSRGYTKAVPSLTELHLAVLKYSHWGFIVIMNILPAVLLASPQKMDFDFDDLLKEMYTNPRYAKEIEQILPWMENRGYLEI